MEKEKFEIAVAIHEKRKIVMDLHNHLLNAEEIKEICFYGKDSKIRYAGVGVSGIKEVIISYLRDKALELDEDIKAL